MIKKEIFNNFLKFLHTTHPKPINLFNMGKWYSLVLTWLDVLRPYAHKGRIFRLLPCSRCYHYPHSPCWSCKSQIKKWVIKYVFVCVCMCVVTSGSWIYVCEPPLLPLCFYFSSVNSLEFRSFRYLLLLVFFYQHDFHS